MKNKLIIVSDFDGTELAPISLLGGVKKKLPLLKRN